MRRRLGYLLVTALLSGMLAAVIADAAEGRRPHTEAIISWEVPAGYEESRAVGDPYLVTYQVQASAPGPLVWATLGTTQQNWWRATGLTPGRWSFRVQAFADGVALGVTSDPVTREIRTAPVPPQAKRPVPKPLAVKVTCDCADPEPQPVPVPQKAGK